MRRLLSIVGDVRAHRREPRVLAARYATELIVLAILAAVALSGAAFIEVADEVLERESDPLDRAILLWIRGAEPSPVIVEMVRDATALGSFFVLTLFVIAAAVFLALSGQPRTCFFVLAATLSGAVMSTALKEIFDRDRPDIFAHAAHVTSASFPSGHALLSAVVYFTLGAIVAEAVERTWLKIYVLAIAILLTVIVGLSRLYLGVHWPTDVLAGWALGAGWAIACWGVARFVIREGNA